MVHDDLESIMGIDKVMIQKLTKADHTTSALRKQRKDKEWCWVIKSKVTLDFQGYFASNVIKTTLVVFLYLEINAHN